MARKKGYATVDLVDSTGLVDSTPAHKCSICGAEYNLYDPNNPRLHKNSRPGKPKPSRLPNEWTEGEVLAHKLSHVDAPKARRILGMFVKCTPEVQREIADFIDAYNG